MWPFKKRLEPAPDGSYDPRLVLLSRAVTGARAAFEISQIEGGYLVYVYKDTTKNNVHFCKDIMEVNNLLIKETAKRKLDLEDTVSMRDARVSQAIYKI